MDNHIEILLVENNPNDIKLPMHAFESYALGVNSYIVKPVDFNQFRQVVRELGSYWLLFNQPPLLGWHSAAAPVIGATETPIENAMENQIESGSAG